MPMTNQEVFDKVAGHLMKQGRQAVHGGKCLYRAPKGLKCAVGCLIEDAEYRPEFEYCGAIGDSGSLWRWAMGKGFDVNLLRALQKVHDITAVSGWPAALTEVARKFGLRHNTETPQKQAPACHVDVR